MGFYRFAIPDSDRFSPESLLSSQIVGLEGIPWPCKTSIETGHLVIFRNTDVSGRLLVPYQTDRFGDISLTSGTLPQKEEPYELELEVARGSLSRLRNQVSIWQEGGLEISRDFHTRLTELTQKFTAALFQHNATGPGRTARCIDVIEQALEMMFEITDEYSRQVTNIRRDQNQRLGLIFGAVGNADAPIEVKSKQETTPASLDLPQVQQTVQPTRLADRPPSQPFDLDSLEPVIGWLGQGTDLRVLGPLLDLGQANLPPWLEAESTFESRLRVITAYCRQLGKQYSGRIKSVHVVAGLNGVGHVNFSYPQQLQVTLDMLEALDQSLQNAALIVSFDQPWGERLSMASGGVPAMEIADSLLRYGARLSAFGLEFNLAYWPHGTMLRDPLQWVDLIDRWSQFGLPLAVYFSAPTGAAAAQRQPTRFYQTICGAPDPQRFSQYLSTTLRLMANRPTVSLLAWQYLTDHSNERFPLAGLLDADDVPKPVASWYLQLCEELSQLEIDTIDDQANAS